MVLDGEERAGPLRGPLEHDGVHHVVDVHDVGRESGHEVVEIDRGGLARLEARAEIQRAGQGRGALVLADRETKLVVGRQRLEDSQEPGVRPAAVGPPVREVQDPHGSREDSPGRDS